MTEQERLQDYREKVLTIRALEEALARCGGSGAPKGLRAVPLTALPGTNDPAAAANQLADGLTAMAERHRAELTEMWPAVRTALSGVPDARTYMVLHQYYVLGRTVEDIAETAYLSPRTVARLKAKGMAALRQA